MRARGPDEVAGCTAIVTVDADPDVLGDMRAHASLGLERFGEWPGFLAGRLYVSDDGTRLVQHLEWTSVEAYVRCRDDPQWDELPSTGRFMDHVRAGRANVDARVFTVAATADVRVPAVAEPSESAD